MRGRYGTPVSASSLSDNICPTLNSIVYLLSKRLSASVKSTMSPPLFIYPCCDAHVLPIQPSGLTDKETTLSFLLNACLDLRPFIISRVLSSELSSIATTSKLGYFWPSIDKRHFSMLSSSFLAGTMTLTNGGVKLCFLLSIIFELFLIIGVFKCEWSDFTNKHIQERSTSTSAASNMHSSNLKLEKSTGKMGTTMPYNLLELNI